MSSEEPNAETDGLHRALRTGLDAYKRFRCGDTSIGEYVKQHGSFFYEWDLDGNESGVDWQEGLAANNEAVELLRKIQQVLDLVYSSETPVHAFEEAGRLTPARAADTLMRLASEAEVDALLQRFSGSTSENE